MVARVSTVAFEGIEARTVDVQVQVAPGLPAFHVVGLADKAVSEARERVRSALIASGLALPARRITVNLAPADLPKEGSHYDLPIALGLMAAIGAIPPDALSGFTVLGELGLPVEKISVNSDGGSRCSATIFAPPSEMSVIRQSRGSPPVPNWIFARLLQTRRSLLRRLAANMSILYPINTVRSVPHWVYRRFVGICLTSSMAIDRRFGIHFSG